ncbi:MAG: glycosyltransferase family 4 protein, partial [Anaerolineales bacterium]
RYFCDQGDEVHLASFYPYQPALPLTSLKIIHLPFLVAGDHTGSAEKKFLSHLLPVQIRTALRQRLVPYGINKAIAELREWLQQIRPQLIHALRIPYEGMVAAAADPDVPLIVSVWGNDFTLHAPATPQMRKLTEQTLARLDGLFADCQRDIKLAHAWGLPANRLTQVFPGAGGVRRDIFQPPNLPTARKNAPLLIHPRGIRAYVRNDVFFQAIAKVVPQIPELRVICPAMEGVKEALQWVKKYHLEKVVQLYPHQTPLEMAALFQQAQIAVSLTEHDGTPNTLLEAMACGCFPIVGDLESLREWITPAINGFVTPADDPLMTADLILAAFKNRNLREKAAQINIAMIERRADYFKVMENVKQMYLAVAGGAS